VPSERPYNRFVSYLLTFETYDLSLELECHCCDVTPTTYPIMSQVFPLLMPESEMPLEDHPYSVVRRFLFVYLAFQQVSAKHNGPALLTHDLSQGNFVS
jgi:hypothetical protein